MIGYSVEKTEKIEFLKSIFPPQRREKDEQEKKSVTMSQIEGIYHQIFCLFLGLVVVVGSGDGAHATSQDDAEGEVEGGLEFTNESPTILEGSRRPGNVLGHD